MSTSTPQFAHNALLQDAADGSVLSLRHRVLDTSHSEVLRRLQGGELFPADPKSEPTIPTCLECGCTNEFACHGGCSWVRPGLCTSCDVSMRPREEIEAEISSVAAMSRENHPYAVAELLRIQCEVLLDIRDLSMYANVSVDPTAELERLDVLSGRRIIPASSGILT